MNFKDALYKPNFSACYGRKSGGTPQIWNKITTNQWFDDNCGADEDWAEKGYEKISE